MKNFVPASDLDESEAHSSWAYYECDKCGFRVKELINGKIELPDDEEWNQFCN